MTQRAAIRMIGDEEGTVSRPRAPKIFKNDLRPSRSIAAP